MRKIIVSEVMSLDGFFAGPNGEIDWHVVDDEFNDYAIELLKNLDTILFGRVTYDLFVKYWPGAELDSKSSKSNREIAHRINEMNKFVFSEKLKNVDWKNTHILSDVIQEEIIKLKLQPGKDMVIYGSGTIVQTFEKLNLIDEYRLIIIPIALGKGKPLFKGLQNRLKLKLAETKTFSSGNILLRYEKRF